MRFIRLVREKKVRKWIVLTIRVLSVVGLVLSCVYTVGNGVAVRGNTEILGAREGYVFEVEDISEDEEITLIGGSHVDNEEIEGYVKVGMGSGTWYDIEDKVLLVEITFLDMARIVGYNVFFVGCLVWSWGTYMKIVGKRDNSRSWMKIGCGIGIALVWVAMLEYLYI